ncbi:hypothetical protein [Lacticaseibacillus hulanensis]|uniref:hypothetical protein n=1 Tax=Lacticaseibacillus hulanensis TaxID=2493111 RepID=UPI000FD7E1FB|nr:hypothetical protein [Lacticaseibacillus hulanensis]
MADIFLIVISVALLALAAYNIYWQSQISLRANYGYSQVMWGAIIAVWMASVGYRSWAYIVCVATFVLLYIMAGVGGLGTKRLVAQGVWGRFHKYENLTGIALTPISAPNGKGIVVAVFSFSRRRVQLMFRQPLESVLGVLKNTVPANTPLTIQKIN